MIYKIARTLNPENGELSYTNDQAAVRDLRSSPEPLNREGLSTLQDNQIPMTYKKTTPTPEDQNQVMKAVVGGSAADIIKAMQQEKQSSLAIQTNKSINSSLYMRYYLWNLWCNF